MQDIQFYTLQFYLTDPKHQHLVQFKTLRDAATRKQLNTVQEEEASNGQQYCPSVCVCVFMVVFNATIMAVMTGEDRELTFVEAQACRRAESVPSGCRSHRAS